MCDEFEPSQTSSTISTAEEMRHFVEGVLPEDVVARMRLGDVVSVTVVRLPRGSANLHASVGVESWEVGERREGSRWFMLFHELGWRCRYVECSWTGFPSIGPWHGCGQ
jgi:hypothetical protein